ncbi:MAG: hypothetical protein AAF633_02415 [Chloroflexota bacterium]
MNKNLLAILALTLTLFASACSSTAEPTAIPVEPAEEPTAEPTDAPAEVPAAEPTEAPTVSVPTEPPPTLAPTEEPEAAAYTGPVAEIAIRRVATDLPAFVAAREAYIDILQSQDGFNSDREFRAFLDFSTFGAPEPAVYIGMTEYESLDAFQSASGAAGSTDEAAAFFSSFDLTIFGALRPVNPEDRYRLADLGSAPGRVIEVAARDLSTYEEFDQVDYESKRDIFLEVLSQQTGFVAEYQWVSMLDENIVVGMTVYENVAAYVAINSSDFVNTAEYSNFVASYPFVAGFANFDAKPAGVASIDLDQTVAFPESVAVSGDQAYVSNFFDGSIHQIDLTSGDSSILVEAGSDGVVAGWGLWVDHVSDQLLACSARNPFGAPPENLNAVKAIDLASGEALASWDLPAGALCNSLVTVANGDIYISDVSPSADVIKIDRTSGDVSIWADEPAWENDSGFGLGGLVWDGGSNLYVSAGGPLVRLPLNEDGSAGSPITQTILDENGNVLPALSFDGFAYSEESSKLYGAAFDFNAFQSAVIEVTIVDDTTVQTGTALAGPLGVTGIDVDGDNIYAVDGQIIQALFVEGYAPPAPFPLFIIVAD